MSHTSLRSMETSEVVQGPAGRINMAENSVPVIDKSFNPFYENWNICAPSLDTFEVVRNTSNPFILPSAQTLNIFSFIVRLNPVRWRQPGRPACFLEIPSVKRFGLI